MNDQHSPGFILHKQPYRDGEVIARALTRDQGVLHFVGRERRQGKAKSQRQALQPLALYDFRWQENRAVHTELMRLTAFEERKRFSVHAGLLSTTLYLHELILALYPVGLPSESLWEAYGQAIQSLIADYQPILTRAAFEWQVLQDLGILHLPEQVDQSSEWLLYEQEKGWVSVPRPLNNKAVISSHCLFSILSSQSITIHQSKEWLNFNAKLVDLVTEGKSLMSRRLLRA